MVLNAWRSDKLRDPTLLPGPRWPSVRNLNNAVIEIGCPFDNGLKLAVGQIAENQKAEKINLKMSSVYKRIKLTFKILQHLLHDFWSLIIL